MEEKKHNLIWGILLIAVGGIFLIGNFTSLGMDGLWPLFPLAVGIAFWVGYFHDKKNFGLLMPGSILIVVSLLFFYCIFYGWWRMEYLWPVFILAPAAGFVAMYFGGTKEPGLLIPAGILGTIGFIFLFLSYGFGNFWPIMLIIAGVLIIMLAGKKRGGEEQKK